MKQIIVFVAVLAMGSAAMESGLRVKFGAGLNVGEDFFFDIPRTKANAIAANWLQYDRPASPMHDLEMYCPEELVICVMFDTVNGFIAGVQVALPLAEFLDAAFDWDVQGFILWSPRVAKGPVVKYMTKQLYFINEATLSKSAEERKQAATAGKVLQEKYIWVIGFNQQLLEIPAAEKDVVSANFTKQACVIWMGQHYYYNMRPETNCTANTMLNWFPLYNEGVISGVGFLAFGNLPEKKGQKFYFEKPDKQAVQFIVNKGPQCLYNLAVKPAVITMHIYFVEQPWRVFCPLW